MERPSQAPAGTTLVELKLMLALAAPSAVLNVCRMGQMVTDQAVIGHLSVNGHATPVYLDAAALALLWMTLTLTIVNRGLNQTINMLVSQALGAGNYQLGDTWLLTGVLIAVPTAFAVGALWLCTAPIVNLFAHNQSLAAPTHDVNGSVYEDHPHTAALRILAGYEPLTSAHDEAGDPVELAGLYARLSIGYILPSLWMEAVNNWLIAHRIIRPQLIIYGIGLFLNFGLNWVLVNGINTPGRERFGGLGFIGSPIATTTTRVLGLIALLISLPLCGIRIPRPKLYDALRPRRLKIFLGQCLPRLLSTLLEELALQTVGAMAGSLDAVETATHNAMLMCFFWLTSPMYGVGTATQQRMGYHLGAGNHKAARQTALICLAISCVLGCTVAITMVLLRNQLGHVFSDDQRVIWTVAQITPVVAGAYWMIGLFYSSLATLGGQGRPLPVALAFFLGAFLVGPVLGYVFTFELHCCGTVLLYGLWLGLIVGYAITTLVAGVSALRSDWPLAAKRAQERSEAAQIASRPCDGIQEGTGSDTASASSSGHSPSEGEYTPRVGGGKQRRSGSLLAAPLLAAPAALPPTPLYPGVAADAAFNPLPPTPSRPVLASEAEEWAEAD